MNYDEAIDVLEDGEWWDYLPVMTDDPHAKLHAALDLALSALREAAEREKGCDWCNLSHNDYLFSQIAELNGQAPIACPWCGRNLTKEAET